MTLEDTGLNTSTFKIATFTILLSRFLFGFDRGAIGASSLGFMKTALLTMQQNAVLVSAPMFASVAGGLLGGFFQMRFGRRNSMLLSTALYILGQTICVCVASPSYAMLLTGRCICNYAFGMAHVTSLVYLLELSPTLYRGQVLVANQLVKPLGNSISGLVNVTIGRLSSTYDWRLIMGSCLAPPIIQIVLLPFIPKSFQWLYNKDRIDESKMSARRLYPDITTDKFMEILDTRKTPSQAGYHALNLSDHGYDVKKNVLFRMAMISVVLMIIPQVAGFTTVMYFLVEIAQNAGITNNISIFLMSEGIFFTNTLGVLISIFLLSKLGRRKLLLLSQIGTAASLLLMIGAVDLVDGGILVAPNPWPDVVSKSCLVRSCSRCIAQSMCGYCSFNSTQHMKSFCTDGMAHHSTNDRCEISQGKWLYGHCDSRYSWLIVLSMILFVVFFSIGLAPIPFVIASEIFPQKWRDRFTGLSISVYYTMTAAVSLGFGVMLPYLGIEVLLGVFFVCTVLGTLFVFLFVPETADVSPEDIHKLFTGFWYGRYSSPLYQQLPSDSDAASINNNGNSLHS